MKQVLKGLDPFISKDTKYLILGSFPSVKSLEYGFYYMHSQNRFYRILSEIFNDKYPETIIQKKEFLSRHNISLFDVIKSCTREGSLDSNIKDIEVNNLEMFFYKNIKIACTGKTAFNLFKKYYPDIEVHYLSSPSPANQKYFDRTTYVDFFGQNVHKNLF